MSVSTKEKNKVSKPKSVFSLELQHDGFNISTKELEKQLKSHLKELGFVMSGCHIKSFFVPAHQTLYYSLEKEGEPVTSGSLSLS